MKIWLIVGTVTADGRLLSEDEELTGSSDEDSQEDTSENEQI